MKGNYKFLLLALLIAFASCSFTSKTFNDPDKDKLLIQLITYVLDQGHFDPQVLNDDFSENVFGDFLDQLDPFKRYFYASDIKEFEVYKDKIDDQLKAYDVTFFNITHQRLLERIEESRKLYTEILESPFDFTKDEVYSSDYEKLEYVKNKRELKERWRQQLKFSTIANYDDSVAKRSLNIEGNELPESAFSATNETSKSEDKKSLKEIEEEARTETKQSLDDLYDFINDRQRKDWFAVYINAIVEEFDPHTFYFAPEDKDRFDVAMSGNFEGIGARLQKKRDAIMINEIISGGPA
ncbi:tail-specific protease, partial [Winogradskyella sp.]|nr:tail-specific protease [Winogradskyella sp.]